MKTIGILGGMSAASTQVYYRYLCEQTRQRLGGLHSPELLIRSVDFAHIEALQRADAWEEAGAVLNQAALELERGGAEVLLLATNTMHKVAERMLQGVSVPFIHIAEATAQALQAQGLQRPGLIATAFTMEEAFYTDTLKAAGLQPLIPEAEARAAIHRIIFTELCLDVTTQASRDYYMAVAQQLVDAGADSLILGCTEVGLLLNAGNVPVPVFDTTLIHCDRALEFAWQAPGE